MNNPISPEQALNVRSIAIENGAVVGDGDYLIFRTSDDITAFANALITKYFGEPVAWQRYHELKGWIDVEAADIEHYQSKGQPIRSLYAPRKEGK